MYHSNHQCIEFPAILSIKEIYKPFISSPSLFLYLSFSFLSLSLFFSSFSISFYDFIVKYIFYHMVMFRFDFLVFLSFSHFFIPSLSLFLFSLSLFSLYIYRVVQIKVYDRVYSLNQPINWFFLCYILFLSIYIYRQFFFCKHVFRINRKKVTVIFILCKRCVW